MKKLLKRIDRKTITVSELRKNRNLRPDITGSISSNVHGSLTGVSGSLTGVSGSLTGVHGSLTGVSGSLDGVSGSLDGVSGSLTGVHGCLDGVSGNIDDCEITDTERENGINIDDLIAK